MSEKDKGKDKGTNTPTTPVLTFEMILAQVAPGRNYAELVTLQESLLARAVELEGIIAPHKAELEKVRERLQQEVAPGLRLVERAVAAARTLGIAVPEEYEALVPRPIESSVRGARTNGGGFRWEPYNPQGEALTPFVAEVSRAMWRVSKGSGGSAGVNNEGVLKAEEFHALLKSQGLELPKTPGQSVTVTLPNGYTVKVSKAS